ncbi:uncharacterized protein SCODWIG_02107 [Saccharomycodes ludwigii]|uniref:holo-[acyl-carrier-protein] synthase n=2 Tax=Saccharomycodes ludwigii TaxID=36035 RepID=A0A376B6M7_9ASCO|nr:uncharacterized protein SCODWIG_02107 [Saccharomycodes ludwigii]
MLALTNGDVSQENSNDKNNIESNSIKFVKGKYGKPLLESSMPIKFSMTTDKLFSSMFLTKGLEDTEVGIDVANVINYCGSNCIDLFRDIFTEQEFNYLSTSPNATTELQKARLFTKYWSFKESYSKYTGEGLNCAFQKVNFGELTIEDDTTIKTYDLHDDIGLVLNFYSKWIDSNRVLTVCYKCSNDHKDNYIVHKRIDLRDVLNYLNGADIFD